MNKTALMMLSLCLSPTLALAGSMGDVQKSWSQVVSLSLGPVWDMGGDQQTFFLSPDIEKTYTVRNQLDTLFSGELFYGLQHSFSDRFFGQIGWAVAGTTNAKIQGDIWDDADVEFNNYIYSYNINHAHVALKGKLIADTGYYSLQPYVSGSFGVGFNHAHEFKNTSKIYEAIVNPNFTANTQIAFSYTAGFGLQREITKNWQAGVGYEFADWGQSKLGRSEGQTLGEGLKQSHMYINGLLFSFTYVA